MQGAKDRTFLARQQKQLYRYYKTIITKIMWYWHQDRQNNQQYGPKYRLMHRRALDITD